MKRIITIVALFMATSSLLAQNEVSLVVSGEGKDKNEATFNALRSAIEQVCGTFISANTNILNDRMVSDEVVSLSSGNIKSYKYISENKQPNGNVYVTVKATVSVDKLTTFCESKGMTAELKGGLFAMNIKKMEFDKLAEEKAVKNLCTQLKTMLPTLFNYEIKVEEPQLYSHGDIPKLFNKHSKELYKVSFTITAIPNENFNTFFKTLFNTLFEISLTADRVVDYKKTNTPVYPISLVDPVHEELIRFDFQKYFTTLGLTNDGNRKINDILLLLPNNIKSHIVENRIICFRSDKTIMNILLLECLFGVNIFSDVIIDDGFSMLDCTGITNLLCPFYKELQNVNQYDWIGTQLTLIDFNKEGGILFDYGAKKFTHYPNSNDSYRYHYDGAGYRYLLGLTNLKALLKKIQYDKDLNVVFFNNRMFSFNGSLFYTLDELSKIQNITVRREF